MIYLKFNGNFFASLSQFLDIQSYKSECGVLFYNPKHSHSVTFKFKLYFRHKGYLFETFLLFTLFSFTSFSTFAFTALITFFTAFRFFFFLRFGKIVRVILRLTAHTIWLFLKPGLIFTVFVIGQVFKLITFLGV